MFTIKTRNNGWHVQRMNYRSLVRAPQSIWLRMWYWVIT